MSLWGGSEVQKGLGYRCREVLLESLLHEEAVKMISFYMPINSTRCSHIFHLRCMGIDLVSLDVDFSGRSNAELPSSYTSARAGECEYLFLSARIVVYDIFSFQHSR